MCLQSNVRMHNSIVQFFHEASRWLYLCKCMYIENFPIPENESQTVILSFIGDRDLLDCCGQSSGGGSTRAAGESANVQHICKVTESIVIITSSEVTKSSFLYYP